MLVTAGIPTLQIWLQKNIVDSFVLVSQGEKVLLFLITIICVYYFMNFLSMLFNETEQYIYEIIRQKVLFEQKLKLAQKSTRLPLESFEDSSLYNEFQLAQRAVNQNIATDVIKHLMGGITSLVSIGGIFTYLTLVNIFLPIALLLFAVPGLFFLIILKKFKYSTEVQNSEVSRETDYTYRMMISREAAKEIRLFSLGNHLTARWGRLYNITRELILKQQKKEVFYGLLTAFFIFLSSSIAALLVLNHVSEGKLTTGDYVSLTGAVLTVQSLLGSITEKIAKLYEQTLYMNHFFDFIEEELLERSEQLCSFPENFSELKAKNLTFQYPNNDEIILNDISFNIKKGEVIAIVGENGSGKSTLIKCLLGLYTPTKGNIYFDNVRITQIDKASLLGNMTAVFQDFIKYNYTIRDNVGFGDISKINNDEKIYSSIKNAGLSLVLDEMPKGLDSKMGREFIEGQEMSGGQWQRLAIARAFMRDSKIIVLDEPTAALDPYAEVEIFNHFMQLSKGKTAIVISHRLGAARRADKILVLRKGKLIEQGSHDELMNMNGEYARMFKTQSILYTKESAYVST
ncbi:ABC transporter ATP-binding protein [Brevibacillus brevis]|nr:ABC transporter ATP-binding protein [Brevibacillus brevis]